MPKSDDMTHQASPEVIFMSIDDAEYFRSPPKSHLISIYEKEDARPRITNLHWESVSKHRFLDAGYNEHLIEACGSEFRTIFNNYIMPEDAAELRSRIKSIANKARLIVVSDYSGVSSSAAVARYIQEQYRFKLVSPTPLANGTVYRLLSLDKSLMRAMGKANVAGGHSFIPDRLKQGYK